MTDVTQGQSQGSAAAAAQGATATAAAQTPWYANKADTETVGHWQNRGWKVDDPAEIALAATKQARELEKHLGVPPERLLKLPGAATDETGWKDIWHRLGAPKEAKDYDLTSVKFGGNDLEQSFADTMRSALFAANVPSDKAASLVGQLVKWFEDQDKSEMSALASNLAAEKAKLSKDWGTDFDFNRLTAMQGAQRLGVTPEEVSKLEQTVGYSRVMEMFRKIGAGTTEDTFRGIQGGNIGNITTVAGAISRKAELMADKAWGARLLAGDADAVREWTDLEMRITGVNLSEVA